MEVFYRPELSIQRLLADTDSIQDTAGNFAEYINNLMKADCVLLVRLDSQMRFKEAGFWQESGKFDMAAAEKLDTVSDGELVFKEKAGRREPFQIFQ